MAGGFNKGTHSYNYQTNYDKTDGMAVYCIENIINGKCYVGITSGFLSRRICSHFSGLRGNNHANKYLQASYNKYGEAAFRVTCLYSHSKTIDNLRTLESFYCEMFNSNDKAFGFNLKEPGFIKEKSVANYKFNNPKTKKFTEERKKSYSDRMKANNHFTGFRHPKEMIELITKKRLEKWAKFGNPNTGRKITKEQSEKQSNAMKGLLSGSKNPASKAVLAYDIGTQKQYLFNTVIEAADHFGIHKCTVDRIDRFEPTRTGLRFMKL